MTRIRIATRGSKLARWQAEHVASRLQSLHEHVATELVPITTRGDRMLHAPLAKVGGKGLFIKELEQAILAGAADIAVHSMKDVPVELPPGLTIPATTEREDPRDVLVSREHSGLDALPRGSRVGTSSLRRQCQLRALRPDLDIANLRGNVNTRLGKLEDGEFDAIVLASAGLKRLGLEALISEYLEPERLLPAIGQGVMGIECRAGDTDVRALIAPLHEPAAAAELAAERALNRALGGGCQVPIAGFAETREPGVLRLRALVAKVDGSLVLRDDRHGTVDAAGALGRAAAHALLARGAREILAEVYADD